MNAARKFAIKAHGSQMYGDQPYVVHLDAVVAIMEDHIDELMDLTHHRVISEMVYEAGYLHDVLEDTKTTEMKLFDAFGQTVALWVANVTDDPGPSRKIRKLNQWYRIHLDVVSVFIKMCDRLANANSGAKIDMYRQEFPAFEAALYVPGQFPRLWKKLQAVHK